MAKLTALAPITSDGKDYAVGDTLTVNDKAQIAQLVDAGAAVPEADAKAKASADSAAPGQAST